MGKTKDNLQAAFAGESQARNMYTFWAEVAREEGYHYIAKLFEETAENERQHARDHFQMLGKIGNTAANLKAAMGGEDYETTTMYPEFAAAADEEGEKDAANLFRQIAKIEARHRDRYKALLEKVESGTVFTSEKPIVWKCGVCGYIVEATEAPKKCPACKSPQGVFEPADLSFLE